MCDLRLVGYDYLASRVMLRSVATKHLFLVLRKEILPDRMLRDRCGLPLRGLRDTAEEHFDMLSASTAYSTSAQNDMRGLKLTQRCFVRPSKESRRIDRRGRQDCPEAWARNQDSWRNKANHPAGR